MKPDTDRFEYNSASEDLINNAEQYQRLVDGLPDIFYSSSLKRGGIIYSTSVFKILGYTPEYLVSHPLYWKKMIHPDDQPSIKAAIYQLLLGKPFDIEYRIRHANGSWIWLRDRSICTYEIMGDTIVQGLASDITERKKAEEELAMAKEDAEASNHTMNEFMANISHEIRTPLNSIVGMSQLLRMTAISSDQEEYLDAIDISCDNMLGLIEDILDLANLEAGRVKFERYEFSLQKAINDVIATQISRIHQKNLTIRTEFNNVQSDTFAGDVLRFKQILVNFLDNAIKFTEKGEIVVSAQILKIDENAAHIKCSVSDTGVGLSQAALEKISAPFNKSVKTQTRRFDGTGLGLSICRRLAELMGGRISVESSPGIGSSFHLMMSFEVCGEPSSRATAIKKSITQFPADEGRPLSVLVAEDNKINRKYISTALQKMGHNVICVENGSQALGKWREKTFDIIFMDVQMPVMDGIKATAIIRVAEKSTGSHVPIIALTANALSKDRDHLLSRGFSGYISKPYNMEDLAEHLKSMNIVGSK